MLRLEYVDPQSLAEHPHNWRRHPPHQVEVIREALRDVGWAGALLVNERTGRLVDGHARRDAAIAAGMTAVPVLVGDWSEAEEARILATLDPIAAMVQADQQVLDDLLHLITDGDADWQSLLPPATADFMRDLLAPSMRPQRAQDDNDDDDEWAASFADDDNDDDLDVARPDPNVIIRLSVPAVVWAGARDEIRQVLAKLEKRFLVRVRIDE